MKNNFYHYSQNPLIDVNQREIVFGDTYDETRKPGKYYLRPYFKPEGLWFSLENDDELYDGSWSDFCHQSEIMCSRLIYKYYVRLTTDANVLILDTVADMYKFRKNYQYTNEAPLYRDLAICWQDVAKEYQGIIIAPYHYSLRLHPDFHWYHPWDCASGCVWDIYTVQSIKLQ